MLHELNKLIQTTHEKPISEILKPTEKQYSQKSKQTLQSITNSEVNEDYLYAFTDGSKLDGPHRSIRFGAWGFWIPDLKALQTGSEFMTNQKAELMAVLYLFSYLLKNKEQIQKRSLCVVTDSQYVIGVLEGTFPKIKKNIKIIEKCKELLAKLKNTGFTVVFQHVFAHKNAKDYFSINNDIIDNKTRKTAAKFKEEWIEKNKSKHIIT
jgi:ribonuclease HI